MFCAKCGNEIKDGELFCSKCEAPVSDNELHNSHKDISHPVNTSVTSVNNNPMVAIAIGLVVIAAILLIVVVKPGFGKTKTRPNEHKEDSPDYLSDETDIETESTEQVISIDTEAIDVVLKFEQALNFSDAYMLIDAMLPASAAEIVENDPILLEELTDGLFPESKVSISVVSAKEYDAEQMKNAEDHFHAFYKNEFNNTRDKIREGYYENESEYEQAAINSLDVFRDLNSINIDRGYAVVLDMDWQGGSESSPANIFQTDGMWFLDILTGTAY